MSATRRGWLDYVLIGYGTTLMILVGVLIYVGRPDALPMPLVGGCALLGVAIYRSHIRRTTPQPERRTR